MLYELHTSRLSPVSLLLCRESVWRALMFDQLGGIVPARTRGTIMQQI